MSATLRLTIVLLFCAAGLALAQSTSGAISGTVMDASSAAIPKAEVTLRAVNSEFVRRTETDTDGSFALPNLQ
jgi:hypothetical protein